MSLSQKKLSVFAGIFGNAVEWYDFTVYAFFAPIIAQLFFPTHDYYTSLLLTFGVFAIGFLVRPLGGLFFGYVGDHFGRKKALIISIVLISVPTFCLALLPGFQSIGFAAPIVLTILRIIQGTAVSGELTSSASFLVEHSASHTRGFAGSLAMCSAFAGIVLSSALAALLTLILTDSQLQNFGWRLPFFFGGVMGLFGLWLRLHAAEPEIFTKAMQQSPIQQKSSVLGHFMKLNYKPVVVAILLTCIMSVGNYFLIGFFNVFLSKNNIPLKDAMLINFVCLLVITFLLPLMGYLSDKIGRKPVLYFGVISLLVLIYPIFWLFLQANFYYAMLGELLFTICLAPVTALIPTTLAELFHVWQRNSGVSIGYNISLAIFGGTAPLIAIALVDVTHNPFSPTWYFIACALISLVVLLPLKESYHEKLT